MGEKERNVCSQNENDALCVTQCGPGLAFLFWRQYPPNKVPVTLCMLFGLFFSLLPFKHKIRFLQRGKNHLNRGKRGMPFFFLLKKMHRCSLLSRDRSRTNNAKIDEPHANQRNWELKNFLSRIRRFLLPCCDDVESSSSSSVSSS